MNLFLVFPYYLYWHYSAGISQWYKNLITFIEFEFNYFSFVDLSKTLFSPFQRLKENYAGSPLEIEAFATALLVNTIMRIVGFIVRSSILIFGSCVLSISIILALILALFWLIAPLVLLAGMTTSIILLIK